MARCYNKLLEATLVICFESLKKMFENNSNPKHCQFKGKCHCCGCDVEVKITRTSGGYGFSGGALCEPKLQKISLLCFNCYNAPKESERSLKDIAGVDRY